MFCFSGPTTEPRTTSGRLRIRSRFNRVPRQQRLFTYTTSCGYKGFAIKGERSISRLFHRVLLFCNARDQENPKSPHTTSYLALTYKLTFFLLPVILRGVSSLQRSAEGFGYSLSINVCHWTVSLHISVRHWAARQLRTSSAGVETSGKKQQNIVVP